MGASFKGVEQDKGAPSKVPETRKIAPWTTKCLVLRAGKGLG